jgi:hypothetical protein
MSTTLADKTNAQRCRSLSVVTNSDVSTFDSGIPNTLGLRSIPYIIFSNVQMDDAGALWLSYAVEHHDSPEDLMGPIKPGPAATAIQDYHVKTGCLGLVYLPNSTLTSPGLKVLKMAEKVRQEVIGYDDEMDSVDDSVPISPPSSKFETPR